MVASLPFAPEIVLPAIDYCINQVKLTENNPYGFKATYNPTYPVKSGNPYGWVSPWHYGLNQGPIILMIENYRTGLLWLDLTLWQFGLLKRMAEGYWNRPSSANSLMEITNALGRGLSGSSDKHGKISVLFEMADFRGWKAAALWDDIKLDLKHFARHRTARDGR